MGVNGEAQRRGPVAERLPLDMVVLVDRRETWQRAWRAKPVGAEIPVRLPWVHVSEPELQDRLDALLVTLRLNGS